MSGPPLSRRAVLKAGAVLAVGVHLPMPGRAAREDKAAVLAPNAFVAVGADGFVTVTVKHLEMGQGVDTGLPALVAEELEVPWTAIRVESAPADARHYGNPLIGGMQGTGGSTSMANSHQQLRKAAAAAREMLLEAAARQLGVAHAALRAESGHVVYAAGRRRIAYGRLVQAAAALPVPPDPPLKRPRNFTVIGAPRLPRTDAPAKSDGTARFGIDVHLPGMVTALVARPPVFGGKLRSFDPAPALAVPGVEAVFPISSGVAVVARDFWAAKKGRDALAVEWEDGEGAGLSTDAIRRQYLELLGQSGATARREGDADATLNGSAKRIGAVYEVPFLAHAPLEPLNCVVRLDANSCEVWTGSQFQTLDQDNAARAAGLKPEQVRIHTMYAGGSFGRRATPTSDYIVEGVEVAVQAGKPVRLMWTREDDIAGGRYRPFFLHGLEAGLDGEGRPVAWKHRLVGQSLMAGTPFEGSKIKDGVDASSVEGAADLPYAIPNLMVDLHSPHLPVPVLWWRSAGHSHNAFVTECFLDELAEAAGQDPCQFRRALLPGRPRLRTVLDLAAARAGWDRPLPAGWGRGVAVHELAGTCVAQVAEVEIGGKGGFRVERVVCAVDCGLAVTPDIVTAQMEGAIAFGLGAALSGAITLKDGRAEQSNFHDYRVLRLSGMPKVEVHVVPSTEPPSGVGEAGVPPIAPAVVNALFAATGKRLRRLPIDEQLKT